MLSSALDHLVVTAPSLESGVQYVERLLGCKMQPGGRHPRMGTHNALLKIGESCYLEVISVDPDAQPPSRKRWFELDTLRPDSRPRLATWVLRTNDIHKVTRGTEIDLGVVNEMNREALEWLITIPEDGHLPLQGVAPAVIQWKGDVHPVSKLMQSDISLVQVTGQHPNARRITALLNAASFEGVVAVAEPLDGVSIGLTAAVQTPHGMVLLS